MGEFVITSPEFMTSNQSSEGKVPLGHIEYIDNIVVKNYSVFSQMFSHLFAIVVQ